MFTYKTYTVRSYGQYVLQGNHMKFKTKLRITKAIYTLSNTNITKLKNQKYLHCPSEHKFQAAFKKILTLLKEQIKRIIIPKNYITKTQLSLCSKRNIRKYCKYRQYRTLLFSYKMDLKQRRYGSCNVTNLFDSVFSAKYLLYTKRD